MSILLDMYKVGFALTTFKRDSSMPTKQIDDWTHANKVCRHTLLSVLSNYLFDVYYSYKEAKIFGILLFSNTLLKTSLDKGS